MKYVHDVNYFNGKFELDLDDIGNMALGVQKNPELKRFEVGIVSANKENFYLIYSCPFNKEDNVPCFVSCFSEILSKNYVEEKDKIFSSEIYKKMGVM